MFNKLFIFFKPKKELPMSLIQLKVRMQKFANDITLNSAVACFIIEGDKFTSFVETDHAGEDEIATGRMASIAANTILPAILKNLSVHLHSAGAIKEAHIYLERGFLTLRGVDVDVAIQGRNVVKKCLFAFLYTSANILTTFDQSTHLLHIDNAMADQTERSESPDGISTLTPVRGLVSLLKGALEEKFNPSR